MADLPHISRAEIERRFHESGEFKKATEFLAQRLREMHWDEKLRTVCLDYAKENDVSRMPRKIVLGDLKTLARPIFPEEVKKELSERVAAFIMQETDKKEPS
ncbi:unnamed protein product [Gongylonema pulchrum]|uniref:Transcription and mRNA export factor ENY2 n=1 Tax=Gongylonema pulchrum TaxID=637853 RepID=A0A183DXT5_9BILA|nr:unnamed protein product [Gongylonema pulchrum]